MKNRLGAGVLFFAVIILGLGLATTTGLSVGLNQQKISVKQAEELVFESLSVFAPGIDLKTVVLMKLTDRYDPDFLYFDASAKNPIGSPHVGYFAVNPWTGDVWNAAGCTRLTSSEIKRIQREIRKQLGVNDKEYQHLMDKKPLCERIR
jgi:hypothetical protein